MSGRKAKDARRRLIAAAPLEVDLVSGVSEGLSFASETQLIKAALLYADSISLHTMKKPALDTIVRLNQADLSELLTSMLPQIKEHMAPQHISLMETYAADPVGAIEAQRALEEAGLAEVGFADRAEAGFQHAQDQAREATERMLDSSGIGDLIPAIDAGVLRLEPFDELTIGEGPGSEQAGAAVLERVRRVLATGHAPMFDEPIGALVRAALSDGLLTPAAAIEVEGARAVTATGIVHKLPSFERASIDEILDIRGRLREQMVRWRSAVDRLTRNPTLPASRDPLDVRAELDALYRNEVAPALLELQESIATDRGMRAIVTGGIAAMKDNPSGVLTPGSASAVLGYVFTSGSLLSTAAGAVIGLSSATYQEIRKARRAARQHDLFFLHAANRSIRTA